MTQLSDAASQPAQEVTPEFRARADEVYKQWHNGEIQFKPAVEKLLKLEGEAGTSAQYADQGLVENVIGMMYGYRADLDMSIRHFARARDLFERAHNPSQIVRAVMNLGESYRLKGDFPRARQFFHTAYDQATLLGVTAIQAFAASNEGHLLLSMNQFDAAKDMFDKAIAHVHEASPDALEEGGRLEILSAAYQGLVTYYLHQNDHSAAWKSAKKSLALSQQAAQPFLLGFAYRTMGDALTALGGQAPEDADDVETPAPRNPDPAATNESLGDPDLFFQLAIEAFQDIKAEGELARTIFAQGQSLVNRGQKVTAGRKFQQATLMFTKLGMKDDATKAAQAQMESQAR